MQAPNCLIISDFNTSNLKSNLSSGRAGPAMTVCEVDFGQVMPVLMDPFHPLWDPTPDILVVWTRPESVSSSFGRVLNGLPVADQDVLDEVTQFVDLLIARLQQSRTLMMPLWTVAPYRRGLGVSDFRRGGVGRLLHLMNGVLLERLADRPTVCLVSVEQILAQQVPGTADKFWYAAKTPFTMPVYGAISDSVHTVLHATAGRSRKLLLLDLDDTVWGGIVGDVGSEGVRLGGHDAVGEAYRDFQQGVMALMRKGVAVGVVSKNEESVALQAIDGHPEMLLRSSMLAGWRINWQDKASNIIDLVAELNLGMDAVVFIDDNPAERGRVSEVLPQVLVPDWPKDPMLYRHALERLSCFDTLQLTDEDRLRSGAYAANRQRKQGGSEEPSGDAWVRSLEIQATLAPVTPATRARAAQLLNKTNQFNLRTRRMTESELVAWLDVTHRAMFTLSASDRFGDLGLIGLVSVELDGRDVRIEDMVLSCRAFGRSLENLMLSVCVDVARRSGAERVRAACIETEKNKPTRDFFAQRSGWQEDPMSTGHHVWDVSQALPFPDFITVNGQSLEACVLRQV